MRKFKSLNPSDLPDGFKLSIQTEEPIVNIQESKGRITIDYVFPGFYLADDTQKIPGESMQLKLINIRSTGVLSESGKPLLPLFGRYVQIPHNCKFKLTVQKSKPVVFDDILVTPAQEMLTDNPLQKHQFEFDKDFYEKDVLYPEDVVKISGPFIVEQYSTLRISVAPLQYNPAKKRITGYGNIKLIIDLTELSGTDSKNDNASLSGNEAYGNMFLNPGLKIEERLGFKIPPIVIRQTGPNLLIIYAKVFEDAALRLARWKNQRGLITEAVCIDSIGNTVPQIKTYIRNRRKIIFTRLRYVLLFGDSDMIATQSDFNSLFGAAGFGVSYTATDYYYSTRYDPATPDPNDPNNRLFFPWISIGRIPVRPDTEGNPQSGDSKAQGVVDQIINYEKNPPVDAAYYKRMLFAAYFQGSTTTHQDGRGYLRTIEEIRTHIAALGYLTERVYVSNDPNLKFYDDGSAIPAAVIAAIQTNANATQTLTNATTAGQLIIGHRDHGNWDGWERPPFKKTALNNVTGSMPSIFYSINCETGAFDYPEPTECFAEMNLRMMRGAPSLIAATRDSGTSRNNDLIRGLYDATFGGVLPTFPGGNASYPVRYNRLGDILNYGKAYVALANSTDVSGVKDHFEIYHVVGDPTLEIWTKRPLIIRFVAKVIRKNLDIRLYRGCPTGAIITIWHNKKMLKRMELTSTHISIPITGFIPSPWPTLRSEISICLWAPGYKYTETKVKL